MNRLIPVNLPMDHTLIERIHAHHKKQSKNDTCPRTNRASCCAEGSLCGFTLSLYHPDKEICHQNTDSGIHNLLQNLRNGGLNHGFVCLEISAEYAKDTAEEYGWCQNPERQYRAPEVYHI